MPILRYSLLWGFLALSGSLFGQNRLVLPANDEPCNAFDLGVLDAPPPCPLVNSLPDTVVVGSTASSSASSGGNPRPFDCLNLETLHDTWYKFEATSERLVIHVYSTGTTPIIAPVFALYTAGDDDDCQGLIPIGCATGTGLAARTFESLIPGEVYYIQVASSSIVNDGDFGMKLFSLKTCDECVQQVELQLDPPPVNGGYPPNTTVRMHATISGFTYLNNGSNRLHGIFPTFGNGWDLTTLTDITGEHPSSVDGMGQWLWTTVNGTPGYYYDADNDGSPSNNLGDLNNQFGTDWECGWEIKTSSNCSTAVTLLVNLNTSTDAQTGSNPNTGFCAGDTALTYSPWLNCCGSVTLVSVTPESCGGGSFDGAYFISVGIPLYDFYLYDSNGNQVDAGSGLSSTLLTASNMSQGTYTAWFFNINSNCWTSIVIDIPGNMTLEAEQHIFGCESTPNSGGAQVNVTGGSGPYVFEWFTAFNNWITSHTSTLPVDTLSSGLADGECYFVKVTDGNNCVAYTAVFCVELAPADVSTMNFVSPVCITQGTTVSPNQQVNGDLFSFNSTPSGSLATIDVNTGVFTPDVEGKYLIYYQSSSSSACPAIFEDTVMVAFVPPTPIVSGQATYQVCEGTTLMPQLAIVNDTAYQAIWLNATFAPVGSGDTYTPPQSLTVSSHPFYAVYYSTFNTSCFSSSTFTVDVFEVPTVELGTDITICAGDTATLTALSNSTTNTFYWQPYDPSYLQTQTGNGTNLAYPAGDITLYIVASLPNPPWCQATDSIHIYVDEACNDDLLPYTGFTPNADGKNDTWIIDGIDQLPNTTVTIYSRWGDKVWATDAYNNSDNAWRGNDSSGNSLPEGTYYFVIISNGNTTQGWVELIR